MYHSSSAATNSDNRRVVVPQDTTRTLTCNATHPFILINSARYAAIRRFHGAPQPHCPEKDYSRILSSLALNTKSFVVSTKADDLPTPSCHGHGPVRFQLTVLYSCSKFPLTAAVGVPEFAMVFSNTLEQFSSGLRKRPHVRNDETFPLLLTVKLTLHIDGNFLSERSGPVRYR